MVCILHSFLQDSFYKLEKDRGKIMQNSSTQSTNNHKLNSNPMKFSALALGFNTLDEEKLLTALFMHCKFQSLNTKDDALLLDTLQELSEKLLFLIMNEDYINKFNHLHSFFSSITQVVPTVLVEAAPNNKELDKNFDGQNLPYALEVDSLQNKAKIKYNSQPAYDKRIFFRILPSSFDTSDIDMLLHSLYPRETLLKKQIHLEKERELFQDIYTSKHEAYSFFISAMKSIENSRSYSELLENLRFVFQAHLPLNSMHLAVYDKKFHLLKNFLGVNPMHQDSMEKWQNVVQEEFEKHVNIKLSSISEAIGSYTLLRAEPSQGILFPLALEIDHNYNGLLLLQLTHEPSISKDFADALHLLRAQLSIALDSKHFKDEAFSDYISTQEDYSHLANYIEPSLLEKKHFNNKNYVLATEKRQ